MRVISSSVKFNYDGGAQTFDLPEGCIPPAIEPPHTSPCKVGTMLGENVLTAVGELLTKKIVFHAGKVALYEPDDGLLSKEKLDEIARRIPELYEILQDVVKDNDFFNREGRQPDKIIENSDGTETKVYRYRDGTQAYLTYQPNGTVYTEILLTSGQRIERHDFLDKPTEEILKDPSGKVIWIRNSNLLKQRTASQVRSDGHEGKIWQSISTFNPKQEALGTAITNLKHPYIDPIWISIPQEVREAYQEAADFYSNSLKQHIFDRMKCFTQKVLQAPEFYLTFVCATTQQDTPEQILRMLLTRALVCGKKVDCSSVELETVFALLQGLGADEGTEDLKSLLKSVSGM